MARQITVLIVEPDKVVRTSLKNALAMETYHVVTAYNAAEALAQLEAHPIDLVLIDAFVAGSGADSLVRRIHSAHPRLPAIVMSASVLYEDRRSVSACMEKPLNFPALFGKIQELAALTPT